MAWNFQREEQQFDAVPVGDYRIRVKSVEKAVSKAGRDMLALQFNVSGMSSILFHYIVFLEERPEITNRNLTQFYESFSGIAMGDLNINNWIGKVGACRVKHDEEGRAKIAYFIRADRAAGLPAWKEPEANTNNYESAQTPSLNISSDDLPF